VRVCFGALQRVNVGFSDARGLFFANRCCSALEGARLRCFESLVEQLDQRRTRIPELRLQAKRSNRQPFPELEMTRGERHEDSSEL